MNFTSPTIVKDLKEYFVRRVADVSSKYCLDLGAWEDGVLGVKDTPYDRSFLKNRNVYAYAWDNVWEWGQGDRAYKLANADYKVGLVFQIHRVVGVCFSRYNLIVKSNNPSKAD